MFENETLLLDKCREILLTGNEEQMKVQFAELINAYEMLIDEVLLLTKIGDRLNNKLMTVNEEIVSQAELLEEKATEATEENNKLASEKSILEEIVLARTNELFATLQSLEKVNNEYEHFVYRTAHNILGPIARIKGLCNIALLEQKFDESYINFLQKDADTLHKIASKLVAAHGIRHHTEQKSFVDLMTVFDENMLNFRELEATNKVPVEKNEVGNKRLAFTDKEMLDTIFVSLIEFIFAHIGKQHKNPRINFNIIYLEEEINLFFEYTGRAINLENKDNLFKIFNNDLAGNDVLGVELYTAMQAAKKTGADLDLILSNDWESTFLLKIKT